jgi:hypothetical protein
MNSNLSSIPIVEFLKHIQDIGDVKRCSLVCMSWSKFFQDKRKNSRALCCLEGNAESLQYPLLENNWQHYYTTLQKIFTWEQGVKFWKTHHKNTHGSNSRYRCNNVSPTAIIFVVRKVRKENELRKKKTPIPRGVSFNILVRCDDSSCDEKGKPYKVWQKCVRKVFIPDE